MPTYDKSILTEQARRLGFITSSFEKMMRLTEILRFLNESDELRKSLALKGGTAINLTMIDLPRLSVDIDMDFTLNLGREETRAIRDKIESLLALYMAAEGYTKSARSKRTHILDSFVYSYTSITGYPENMKVEINYSLRSHVLSTVDVAVRTAEVFTLFQIRTLAPVEIFASKIVALSDRAAVRDLYDLNNMVYYNLFSEPDIILLRKCAVFYKAVAGDTTSQGFDFKRIDDITPYRIRTELRPMIRNVERFDLQAARDRVSAFIDEWMILTENESSFLKHFRAGRYEPHLLFDDSEIVKRIENHPMAQWRLQRKREEQAER